MAEQPILISYSVTDIDGDRASMPVYGTYDDATATIGTITAWAAARCSQLDAVCDGQIVSMAITLYPSLPGGIKGTPNAGSDVEKTALFTFGLGGLASAKSHGMDVPAWLPADFLGDNVNTTILAVQNFRDGFLPPYGTITPKEPSFYAPIATLRRAVKSFRKSG